MLGRRLFKLRWYHPGRGPYIGSPVRGLRTGVSVIVVSRRLNNPGGSFAGVVVAAIDIGYFERFYDSFDIGDHGLIILGLNRGVTLARRPLLDSSIGKSLLAVPIFRDHVTKNQSGKIGGVLLNFGNRSGDLYARYGGEELVVLLPGADTAGAIIVAEKIRLAVRALNLAHEGNPHGIVTISLGVASYAPVPENDLSKNLPQSADNALYAAKNNGRDRVCSQADLADPANVLQLQKIKID